MKLVYLLVVLSNGEPIRNQDPILFASLRGCTATAKRLNYQGRKNYDIRRRHPVKAHCEPRWVTEATATFR
mgnify:CR=1 FL=1|jgi:hypothetical protein